jgi:predicted secreted Zn-dependent protease
MPRSAALNRQIQRWPRGAVVLAALFAAVPPVAAASVPLHVDEQQRHYLVDASEWAELRRQVDGGRPQSRDGRPSHGLLMVDLATRYRLQPVAGGCLLEAPQVDLALQLWLPRWQPAEAPSEALRSAWEAMLAGLSEHERGHREHALQVARELATRMDALPRLATDCGSHRRELLGLRLSAMSRLALRDAAYDRRTEHGQRQGAELALDEPPAGDGFCAHRETAIRRNCRTVR